MSVRITDADINGQTPKARRDRLIAVVKEFLGSANFHAEHSTKISTRQLVDAIYPEHDVHGAALTRRQLLYDDLQQDRVRDELRDYWSYGETIVRYGRTKRPLIWHKPRRHRATKLPDPPQRYYLEENLPSGPTMWPSDRGDYVRWEDVAHLFNTETKENEDA